MINKNQKGSPIAAERVEVPQPELTSLWRIIAVCVYFHIYTDPSRKDNQLTLPKQSASYENKHGHKHIASTWARARLEWRT